MTLHRSPSDETDWLATRYVLGELAPVEASAFEMRLAEDQEARDAVVRAALLVESVAEIPWGTPTAAPKRRFRLGRVAALLASIAAVVLVGVAVLRNAEEPRDRPQRVAGDEVDPARLAVLWSDSAKALNGAAEGGVEEVTASEGESVLLPPDWMLAAVEYESMLDELPLDGSDEIERN